MRGKYRVWDDELQSYVQDYSDYIINPEGELLFYDIDGLFKRSNTEICTVEFYAGIKDKHDNEICDGDICKYREDTKGQIRFEDGCFWFDCRDWSEPIYIFSAWEFEIIGNIHKNQKLLEVL